MSTEGVWIGAAERFAEHCRALGDAGATWVIVVAAGPADRAEVILRSARAAG
jgi:hypothetical protein